MDGTKGKLPTVSVEQFIPRNLRLLRERRNLSQADVAAELGTVATYISAWETGRVTPSVDSLYRLAEFYQVSMDLLVNPDLEAYLTKPLTSFRPYALMSALPEKDQQPLNQWLKFLEDYHQLLSGLESGSSFRYLKQLPITFRQLKPVNPESAAALAAQFRQIYRLGQGPLPELYNWLDQLGILVYRGYPLRELPLTGAVTLHPSLGYSFWVDASRSEDLQAQTLALGLAYLIHAPEPTRYLFTPLGSPQGDEFYRAWAEEFLIPSAELSRVMDSTRPTPELVLRWANYFRVSYPYMLLRLHQQEKLDWKIYSDWSSYHLDPLSKELKLSLSGSLVQPAQGSEYLRAFPASVLIQLREALFQHQLSLEDISSVLGVESSQLRYVWAF